MSRKFTFKSIFALNEVNILLGFSRKNVNAVLFKRLLGISRRLASLVALTFRGENSVLVLVKMSASENFRNRIEKFLDLYGLLQQKGQFAPSLTQQ